MNALRPASSLSTLKWSAPPRTTAALPQPFREPVESLEQAEAAPARPWPKVVGAALLVAAAAGLVAGCGSGASPVVESASSSVLQLMAADSELAVEIMPVAEGRLDIVRQTRTEKDDQGRDVVLKEPYSPFGVHLGDGLFLDLNGNVSLIPERAFEAPTSGQFTRVRVDPAGWGNDTEVRIGSGGVRIDPPGLGNGTWLGVEPGRVNVNPPGLGNELRVSRSGNRVEIDPPGWNNDIVVERGEGWSTVDPPGWANSVTIYRSQDRLEVDYPGFGRRTVVRRDGNRISIDPPGWFNTTEIRRSGQTTRYDPPGWGNSTRVRVAPGRTVVDPPGLRNSTTITRE